MEGVETTICVYVPVELISETKRKLVLISQLRNSLDANKMNRELVEFLNCKVNSYGCSDSSLNLMMTSYYFMVDTVIINRNEVKVSQLN